MSARTEAECAELEREVASLRQMLAESRSAYAERIDHQAATIDVLKAMSASPGDPQPVFDLIVQRARDLCDAYGVTVTEFDGTLVHLRASTGISENPEIRAAVLAQYPYPPARDTIHGRVILDRRITRIDDHEAEPGMRPYVRTVTGKSSVSIPLMRGDAVIGTLGMGSRERGGFSDSQIELLKTFAEQAVIAISSAETYRALQARTADLQQSLEYQTATSDVLKVISRSTFDLQPVLDTLVEAAARLCDADQAIINRREGVGMRLAANFGFPPEYEAHFTSRGPVSLDAHTVSARAASERHPVHIHDVTTIPGYPEVPIRLGKQRTSLGVPLLREGEVIGTIVLARRRVEPFTERQIELVSTFADQAVIAIENTRLMTEQREALEQQTATAEILQVINVSPGDLAPLFDTLLEKAMLLCGAAFGSLYTHDGEGFHSAAHHGVPADYADFQAAHPPASQLGGIITRILEAKRPHQVPDVMATEAYRAGQASVRALADLGGARTNLFVPLRKGETVLGVISIYRQEVRAFSDREVALLENFAAQAVIAMENARLLNEQREALEQQTATAEVLEVINASPGNVAPVFDAMLERAMRLCGAAFGVLRSFDGNHMSVLASRGVPAEYAEFLARDAAPGMPGSVPDPGAAPTQALQTGRPVQVLDVRKRVGYTSGRPSPRAIADLGGARTMLHVPLVKDHVSVGLFTIYRQEVRGFSDKQVALLENFAAQAVIAIENARLLNEQREALEQQTAMAEVLQVINASPGNLVPVFDAILEKAHRLSGAALGAILTFDGEYFHAEVTRGYSDEFAAYMRRGFRPRPLSPQQALVDGERFVQIADLQTIEQRQDDDLAFIEATGVRTFLVVPLRKDGRLLGLIGAHRHEARVFTDKEITLLESFAAQAVIAMETARLLNEIRHRQAELRTTFDNMADGVAMFDGELRLAAWNRNFQQIIDLPDALLAERPKYADYMRLLAERGEFGATGIEAEIRQRIEDTDKELRLERVRPDGQVIEVRRNAVPGGGFVLIYSDVTERKRSEEQIRAARDAAEAALRDLKAAQANLIQAEKMASLGQLTAGIAHEIKNPLNFVNNFASLSVELLDELKQVTAPAFATLDADRRADIDELSTTLTNNLAKITEHGKRADGIVRSMLEHSRGSSGERRAVDLNALVEDALNLAYHGARAQDQSFNVTLERDFGAGIAPITLTPQDITRVLLNLFGNGFYAVRKRQAADGADYAPTLRVATRDLGDAVEIRVWDNGTGVPAEIRDKLFQPFFTTKPAGEGTGLGLSLSYDIVVKQHGGQLTVDSRPDAFTEFAISLPRRMTAGEGVTP